MAVVAHQDKAFTTPCGPCRQFMAEFGTDIMVYITRPTKGQVMVASVKELLPYSFSFWLLFKYFYIWYCTFKIFRIIVYF